MAVCKTETTQFVLDAVLTAYKREDDCDYHLILDVLAVPRRRRG
jgi:hypothetical protein